MEASISDIESKMKKTIESTKSKFSTVRTGRANPELLNRISVEYYGASVPIVQVANISVSEGNTLILNVFDRNAVESVEKSIMKSDLNITPQTEGSIIRLRLPDLTEDRRQELLKIIKNQAEEGKVALRHLRRDFLDGIKKDDSVSEDEEKKYQEDIQKLTDQYASEIDTMVKEKETELFHI